MADFPLTPDFPVEETIRDKTLISEYDNGNEQRRSKWSAPLREFTLSFKNRTTAEYQSLKNFILSKRVALISFTFTNPNDGTDYTVRFKDDNLRLSLINASIYEFGCVLVEVR